MADTLFQNGTVILPAWLNDVNRQTYNSLTGVTGSNAIVANGPQGFTGLFTGQVFWFFPQAPNTTAVTLNVSGLGARPVTKNGSLALVAGDLALGVAAQVYFDGTQYQLTNPQNIVANSVSAANISGQVAIANGGTGASTAATARDTLGIGSTLSWRNKLINANGAINQRGYVSGTVTTGANQYTLDRWRVVVSGQALTYTASGLTTTMTAPAGGLEQVVEAASNEGGVYTLSWTGTATATVNGAAIANGGQTAALTTNTTITVRFTGGTVALPQLEKGSIVTSFEWRPYAIEFDMCQYYFIRFNYLQAGLPVGVGAFYSATQCQIHVQLPKMMRIAPNITASTNTWSGLTGAGSINLGPGSFQGATPQTYLVNFLSTATATNGDGVLMRSPSSQWIQADAEL